MQALITLPYQPNQSKVRLVSIRALVQRCNVLSAHFLSSLKRLGRSCRFQHWLGRTFHTQRLGADLLEMGIEVAGLFRFRQDSGFGFQALAAELLVQHGLEVLITMSLS